MSKFNQAIFVGGALGALVVILGYAAIKDYKNYRNQPPLTTVSRFGNKSRFALDGLGVGKSYTFPRNSMPVDPTFVKEV